jgi:hypothetical protein
METEYVFWEVETESEPLWWRTSDMKGLTTIFQLQTLYSHSFEWHKMIISSEEARMWKAVVLIFLDSLWKTTKKSCHNKWLSDKIPTEYLLNVSLVSTLSGDKRYHRFSKLSPSFVILYKYKRGWPAAIFPYRLQGAHFSSNVPTKILYALLVFLILGTCPSHGNEINSL